MQHILRTFYAGRISIRLLVDQHFALRRWLLGKNADQRGRWVQTYVWRRLANQHAEAAAAGAPDLGGRRPPGGGGGGGDAAGPGSLGERHSMPGVLHPNLLVHDVLKMAIQDAAAFSAPLIHRKIGQRKWGERGEPAAARADGRSEAGSTVISATPIPVSGPVFDRFLVRYAARSVPPWSVCSCPVCSSPVCSTPVYSIPVCSTPVCSTPFCSTPGAQLVKGRLIGRLRHPHPGPVGEKPSPGRA